jgi:phage FluMu protein Com
MSVLIRCEQCEKKLSIPEAGLGKKIRCPACQTVFVATAESAITSAPTAAPASPTSTVKKAGGPPPMPTRRRDDDDVDERDEVDERPKRRRRREESEPFRPINFRLIVKTKTEALKKGNYAAVLDEEGILVKRSKKLGDFDIPIGTRADYDGKNNMTVDIDGEPVKMQVARFRTYPHRFTEAIVDYLNRDLRAVHIDDYEIPWYMFILVILPLISPLTVCIFGAIPFGIAGGMAGANFAVINQESWSPTTRIVVAAILTGLTYITIFVLAFFIYRAQAARFGF